MKKIISSALVVAGMFVAGQASAHVGYRDLDINNPFTNAVTSNFGWYEGTEPTLANSHDLTWFTFNLAQDSYVDISVASTGAGTFAPSSRTVTGATSGSFTSVGDLNVAFSLFSGKVPASSVEYLTKKAGPGGVGITEPSNHQHGITTNGTNTTPYSAFLGLGAGVNTLTNSSGVTGSISYITHVNDSNVNGVTETLSDYLLAAGSYTILVGGASYPQFERRGYNADGTPNYVSINGGTYGVIASLSSRVAAPVPVPAAVWLFGSALVGFVGLGRRKALAA